MKLAILITAVFAVSTPSVTAQNVQAPVVLTANGPVRGFAAQMPRYLRRRRVNCFLGIPYAKPPVRQRRFQLPEPADPFPGVYEATSDPPFCPQVIQPFSENYLPGSGMSEDCLYLNVHVPEPAPPNAAVMVYIHGGGFETNSGSDYLYNPLPLATLGNVIVVTFNYRLNIFGFLTTGDPAMPPNLGLRDQQRALLWVHENIAAFGGNPDMVTIFGESAGSLSVGYHLLSSDSRELFQRAIMQSGTPLNAWGVPFSAEQASEWALRIAGLGQCTNPTFPQDTNFIANCMRSKSMEELVQLVSMAASTFEGATAYRPMIDGAFFAADVQTLVQQGGYRDKDILLGTNKDEGTFTVLDITGYSPDKPFITKELFGQFTQTSANPLLLLLLEAVYARGIDDERNYVYALSDAFTDLLFICPVVEFANQVAAAGCRTYMYHMTAEPIRSLWNASWVKSSHIEEIQFVFGLPFADHPFYTPVYNESWVSYYVIQMWANFAKSGDPNTPGILDSRISEWPQFVPEEGAYKELDLRFRTRNHLRCVYCNFWATTFPEVGMLQAVAAGGATGTGGAGGFP